MENKTNNTIPAEVINEATQLLNNTVTVLTPYLIALTPAERQTIAKMSDKTYPFVEKTLDYTASAAQFIPPYMNQPDLSNDFKTFEQLTQLLRVVNQLQNGIDDSSMQVGGECYMSALNYYNSVKQAAKTNVPGAKAIYEDLNKRFAKNRFEKEEDPDEVPVIE